MAGEYRLTDEWTTRDGKTYPTDEMYSIDQAHADRMKVENIDGAGCATCYFVKLEGGPAKTVEWVTTANYREEHEVDSKGWAHIAMYNPGSGYNPNNNVGPWTASAKNAPGPAEGGVGLPFGWHVSTFKVLTWKEEDEGNGGPVVPPDGGGGDDGATLPDTITTIVEVSGIKYFGTLSKVQE